MTAAVGEYEEEEEEERRNREGRREKSYFAAPLPSFYLT